MVELRSTTARRSAPQDYTAAQNLLLGLWLFDIWDGAGFNSMYEGEERRFMPRLLIGSCVAALKQRPLSITDAFVVMDAKHGRTAAKYIGLAESQGLLSKVRDPDGDARKTFLVPTRQLERKFCEEMRRIADDTRELIVALVNGYDALPDTGAAEISVRRRKNEANRHTNRLEGSAPFPSRNWSGGYYGPK